MKSVEVQSPLKVKAGDLIMEISPDDGNRIASLRSRSGGREFLWQDGRAGATNGPSWVSFNNSGWIDCFPTVAVTVSSEGVDLGDHGWLWSRPWSAQPSLNPEAGSGAVCTSAVAPGGLAAWREASPVGEGAILLRYRLENRSPTPIPALFAAHPLLAVSPTSRLLLPPEVKALRQRVPLLPGPPPWLPWPEGVRERLDTGLRPEAGTRQKLFTGRLSEGWAALYHPEQREGLALHFSPSALPYVGIWRAQGFQPAGRPGTIYALGLEPTNWPWETPLEGEIPGPVLLPGEAFSFAIGVQLLQPHSYAGEGRPPAFPASLDHGL